MSIVDKMYTLQETSNEKISFNNKNYGFKVEEIETYLNIYQSLKSNNIIKSGEFSDSLWVLFPNPGKSKQTINFIFDLEIYKEFNVALKCFILQLTHKGYSLEYLKSLLRNIKQAHIQSKGFSSEFRNQDKNIIIATTERKKEELVNSNLMFAEFYSSHWDNDYEKMFKSISLSERKIRALPNYESVIQFDDILLDFMESCTIDERKKYMPVLLWWRISKIIPLRPAEFLSLKANCISSVNGRLTITVPREKQKGVGNIEVTNTLRITKEIYNLIFEYLALQSESEKGEYLMSYMSYNSCIKERSRKSSKYKRNRIDKMDIGQMRELVDDFYTDIVGKRYGFPELERVKLGDTRHFAFCNMMLQGYNMLTIARIGGHLHLKSQLTYTSHLDYFADARVRVLSETIKRNREQNLGDTYLSDTNSLVIRSKLQKGKTSNITIQGGFCFDKDFPNNCIDDCVFCPHFQLDLVNNPELVDSLKLKSSKYSQNIKDQIETMQRFTTDMLYDKATLQYSHEDQEQLFVLASKLRGTFNKKAMIDSFIP